MRVMESTALIAAGLGLQLMTLFGNHSDSLMCLLENKIRGLHEYRIIDLETLSNAFVPLCCPEYKSKRLKFNDIGKNLQLRYSNFHGSGKVRFPRQLFLGVSSKERDCCESVLRTVS